MLISTDTGAFEDFFSYEEILNTLKEAGFDAYDFSMYELEIKPELCLVYYSDYVQKAKKIRFYADKLGIICNQTHATCPSHTDDDEERFKCNICSY